MDKSLVKDIIISNLHSICKAKDDISILEDCIEKWENEINNLVKYLKPNQTGEMNE